MKNRRQRSSDDVGAGSASVGRLFPLSNDAFPGSCRGLVSAQFDKSKPSPGIEIARLTKTGALAVDPRAHFQLHLADRQLRVGDRTLIMGVLNVTPDSFFDGGRYFKLDKAVDRGVQIEQEGADIIDIGGESTRPPRSGVVPGEEEIRRVIPVIERLRKKITIPISIDTTKSKVAKAALESGAQIVNDVSGLRFDTDMSSVIAASGAGAVLTHSRGSRDSMHALPRLRDIVRVVVEGLERSVQKAVGAGIRRNQIIVDPGLGFGKQHEDNLLLLKKLDRLRALKFPLLIGASRKSFLGKILEAPPKGRLVGSLACAAVAIIQGAHIIRVHDIEETRKLASVCDAVRNSSRKHP